jgi:hypothetical protein
MVLSRQPEPLPSTQTSWLRSNPRWLPPLLIAMVLLLSALYAAHGLKRGWVPADEGFLGQSAERVLHGELPHREYSEGYTGGLTFLNATAFQIFGTNLASLRYMLFLFFLLWVAAYYYSATHFLSAPVSAALTLLAVAWSIPNYSAAMPSWYNLFFATFGVAALLRYLETERWGWLFAAGLCGGISLLFKITGLYLVAGVLLFFLFRELLFREYLEPGAKANRRVTIAYRVFLLATVLSYEALVFSVLQKAGHPAIFLYFWVPELAIGAAILWLEFGSPENRSQRFMFLFRELTPFAAGVAVPLAIFLGRYVLAGSQSRLIEILTLAGRQVDVAVFEPSLLKVIGGTSLNLMLIAAAFLMRGKAAKAAAGVFMLGIPIALVLAWKERYVDRAIWGAIWCLLPVVVVCGAVLLIRGSLRRRVDSLLEQKIFLVLSVTAACSLIQFPFTIPIYFCYVAPLAFLAAAAVSCVKQPPKWIAVGALCLAFAYVVLEVTPGFIEDMGEQYSPDKQVATLTIPRAGGLRVYTGQARAYEELAIILKQHARGGYIYATPDCPEVYFLNGFRNPTPTLYDLADDPVGRTERILQTIRQHDINLVVLNAYPQFSPPVPTDLRAALESEFPNRALAGKFEVRWKP